MQVELKIAKLTLSRFLKALWYIETGEIFWSSATIGFENFDLPIVGSKIKIVVNLSVTYQNLSGEK